MLAFYWGVFPADRPTLRKAMYVVTAYVCCAYMCVLWMDTFYCGVPVSVQWSQEKGACSVFYADTPFYFNFSMNLSSYIFSKFTLNQDNQVIISDKVQSTVSPSSCSRE
jgi:hypothetical protein